MTGFRSQGDAALVVVVSSDDMNASSLAQISWRARASSAVAPHFYFAPPGQSGDSTLHALVTLQVVALHAGIEPWLLEIRTSQSELIEVATTPVRGGSDIVSAIEALARVYDFPIRVNSDPNPVRIGQLTPDIEKIHRMSLSIPRSLTSGYHHLDVRLVAFVSQVIRVLSHAPSLADELQDADELLEFFGATSEAELASHLGRANLCLDGAWAEIYLDEDDRQECYLGMDGEGYGFEFPARVTDVMTAAKRAYADWAGDFVLNELTLPKDQ